MTEDLVLTQVLTVIRGQGDDRALTEPPCLQLLQEAAHELVHVPHSLVIAPNDLRAAIAVTKADPSLQVALVSKVYPMRSHTVAAEGGAAAVIKEYDSLDNHIYDTISGGDWLVDQGAVELFVNEALGIRAFVFNDPEGYQIEMQSATRTGA